MTNSKKSILILLAFGLLATTGCKKEEVGEKATVDFTVSLEGHSGKDTKMHLSDDWKPCWDLDPKDHIQINDVSSVEVTPNNDNPTRGTFTATITGTSYYAVYPAGIVSGNVTANPTITLPRVQVYETLNGKQKINAPMAAYNPSHPVLEFKNLCGLLAITVTNNKAWDMILDSIHVESSGANISGNAVFDITGNEPTLTGWSGTNAKKIISLAGERLGPNSYASMNERINSNQNHTNAPITTDGKTSETYYITLPPVASGTSNMFTIRVFSHPIFNQATNSNITISEDVEENVHIVYTKSSNSSAGYIMRSEIVPVQLNLSEANIVFTSMKAFSVSSTQKVCFSRGYAQYNMVSQKWRFAPRQWSFLNQTAPKYHSLTNQFDFQGTSYTGQWIEFFGWATGDNPTRGRTAEYMAGTTPDGTGAHGHVTDLTGNYRTRDWGNNFNNTGATWYTPSKDEWHYVFKDRTRATMNDDKVTLGGHTYKFGWATIQYNSATPWGEGNSYSNNLYGVILIPDGVNPKRFHREKGAARLNITEFISHESAMGDDDENKYRNDNIYSQSQFEYLEAHGCIFFPCIGHIRLAALLVVPLYVMNNDEDNQSLLNPSDVRIWSRTYATGHADQAYQALFDSGNENSSTQTATRNVLDAHDLACDLHCVRLVCNYGTPYIWDPDQM